MNGRRFSKTEVVEAWRKMTPANFPGRDDTRVVETDGGRSAAGYRGSARDCVCRAISVAAQLPYQQVYDRLNELASKHERGRGRRKKKSNARDGVFRATSDRLLRELGWVWTPTMSIGSGCQVHLRADELPPGRLVVKVSRHLVAVIDGVIHDTHDPSRGGSRCVYGYWSRPAP